jgi:hypothetical protein
MGKVETLTIILGDENIGIKEIVFNASLPWLFRLSRVLFLTLITSIGYFWKKYQFGNVLFNALSWRQRVLDITVLTVFISILFFTMFYSADFGWIPNSNNPIHWSVTTPQSINARMVDALLLRQLHLDLEVHESLLNATQPYNRTYRIESGVVYYWDYVFYEGRYYSYFGIVPVLILYLPFYFLFGNHLSDIVGTFIFAAVGSVGIYFLWKELTERHLKNVPYVVYLAGLICALLASNLMSQTVDAHKYAGAIVSAFMFSVWGLFFMLRSVKHDYFSKSSPLFLFFGGLCLALAVGCRPTAILFSLLVPVILFPALRNHILLRKTIVNNPLYLSLIVLALPYIIIGAGLMWYNYARFGSIAEFGATYQLTLENISVITDVGALGTLRRAFDGLFLFLFTPFSLSPHFPFVSTNTAPSVFTGFMSQDPLIGVFALPITWFLPVMFFKRDKKATLLILNMIVVALITVILSAVFVGVQGRYSVDFFWLFAFSSLLCMGCLYKDCLKFGETITTAIRRLSFSAIGVTCFIMFAWGMVGRGNRIWHNNPIIIQYISDLIVFF